MGWYISRPWQKCSQRCRRCYAVSCELCIHPALHQARSGWGPVIGWRFTAGRTTAGAPKKTQPTKPAWIFQVPSFYSLKICSSLSVLPCSVRVPTFRLPNSVRQRHTYKWHLWLPCSVTGAGWMVQDFHRCLWMTCFGALDSWSLKPCNWRNWTGRRSGADRVKGTKMWELLRGCTSTLEPRSIPKLRQISNIIFFLSMAALNWRPITFETLHFRTHRGMPGLLAQSPVWTSFWWFDLNPLMSPGDISDSKASRQK